MAFGTLELTLRPLRLAFLVDPADRAGIMEAIQINTFLWGGAFNPIIPVFRRLPAVWHERYHVHLTARALVSGYIDAFDPDFVVKVGKVTPPDTGLGFREVISAHGILEELKNHGLPKYGISLTEVLNHFANEELKFLRHDPVQMRLPEWGRENALFFAAVFGSLPVGVNEWLRPQLATLPGIEWKPCSIENFSEFLNLRNHFLRRFGSLYVTPVSTMSFPKRDCIFFMDASKAIDVFDYWNLRAAGWNVIPAPKQALGSESFQALIGEFVREHSYPLRGNPRIFNTVTVQKSRCTSAAEVESFCKQLQERNHGELEGFRLSLRTWQLPVWDESARDLQGAECCDLESEKTEQAFDDFQGLKRFDPVDPPFASSGYAGHDKPRFANRMDLRVYGGDEPSAEAIPESGRESRKAFHLGGFEDIRFSKRGPVYLARHPAWSIHITVPKAEQFFRLWLEQRGWSAELSDKGHIAKQMLRQLGGVNGTRTLADEGVLSLLRKLENARTLEKDAFRDELNRICAGKPVIAVEKLAKRLVEVHAVQLGLEFRCPRCRQRSWYSLKDADYDLDCPKCLQRFSVPCHVPNQMVWSYRSTGPFSLPHRAYGAYASLLALRFFANTLDGATTPFLSFVAKKPGITIEVDLGLFFQEKRSGPKTTSLAFVECKSNNEFEKTDVDRMSKLAGQFPGAILVFATLNKSLSKREQALLRNVANRGRRFWKAGHLYNPVLILTGVELFSEWPPNQAWEKAGGKHASYARYNSWPLGELLTLCDITQQIYLDLPPATEWFERKRKEKVLGKFRTQPGSRPPPGSLPAGGEQQNLT